MSIVDCMKRLLSSLSSLHLHDWPALCWSSELFRALSSQKLTRQSVKNAHSVKGALIWRGPYAMARSRLLNFKSVVLVHRQARPSDGTRIHLRGS
jgi:hypothetical protein